MSIRQYEREIEVDGYKGEAKVLALIRSSAKTGYFLRLVAL